MFKPMLAGKAPEDLSKLTFPVLASPKLDGIRCIIRDGQAVSRNMKPIPNVHVRAALAGLPDGMDGELMVEGGFSACSSFFMKRSGPPSDDFVYFVFDWSDEQGVDTSFEDRLAWATKWSETYGHNNLKVVEHVVIENVEDLQLYVAKCLLDGFEGAMVRDPQGAYKFGRSTTREGGLLKIKMFADEEATIVGFEERMHNDNVAEKDAFGRTKRSTHKENKRPAGDMGAIECQTEDGALFRIGTGFTAAQRASIWESRGRLLGALVKFKHQPDPGGRQPGQAPRFPVFLGFRSTADLS